MTIGKHADGKSLEQQMPKTGHAVLTEGSIQCLALSRRGLYTGGKVRQTSTQKNLNMQYRTLITIGWLTVLL